MSKKYARNSDGDPYACEHEWPEDCFVQCGGDGVVFTDGSLSEALKDPGKMVDAIGAVLGSDTKENNYRTAFFEAFPKDPDIFIRGEGETIKDAETDTWEKYQSYLDCPAPEHEFKRQGYTNGGGFCIHCGMFKGRAFEPITGKEG